MEKEEEMEETMPTTPQIMVFALTDNDLLMMIHSALKERGSLVFFPFCKIYSNALLVLQLF